MSKPDMGSIFHINNQWNILVIGNYYVNYQNHQNSMLLNSILNEHWCIYSCLQIPPRENFTCITFLLFIIYIHDFFQSNKLFSVAFAEETNVASMNTFVDTINKKFEKITCWYMSNKLTINFEKTNAILF